MDHLNIDKKFREFRESVEIRFMFESIYRDKRDSACDSGTYKFPGLFGRDTMAEEAIKEATALVRGE